MLDYVTTRFIDPLLTGPVYLRLLMPVLVASVLSFLLVDRFIVNLWESSGQVDQQLAQINLNLARYERQRESINDDYRKLVSSSRLVKRLELQFSDSNSDKVESWLIRASVDSGLRPIQVRINTRLKDDRGEFFRVTFKISGPHMGIESFLQTILRSDYFLIWERLVFETVDSNQLGLTIVVKQYVYLYDQDPVTG